MTPKKEPSPIPARSDEEEVMRTYKVGLRVPESLLREQNALVVELEVLNHVRTELRGKKPSNLFSGKVSCCSREVRKKYENALNRYKGVRSLQQADMEISRVSRALKHLLKKSKALNSLNFSRTDVPSFQDPSAPSVKEISLTDYQTLARASLKLLCKHLNDQILNEIQRIPRIKQIFVDLAFQTSQKEGRKYTMSQIKSRFEIALANITGIHSNIGRTAFYQLGMAMKVYFDLRDKVEFVRQRIDDSRPSSVDFSGVIPVLLSFYSLPNHLRKYIARSWRVDSEWVRNTLIGWRRKLDPSLPIEFQVEPLTERFTRLADSFKESAQNEEEVRVLSKLQEKHVLHLLPDENIDLSPLLPQQLHPNYRALQGRILKDCRLMDPHVHSISLEEFLQAAGELIENVQAEQSRFSAGTQPFKNCQGFLNKVNYLIKEANNQEVQEILKNYVIGNRFTRNVALLLSSGSKYTRLFTAIAGIIALTLAKKHHSAIGQFLSAFSPDTCLTFPFTSRNREKSHLPVNLLFNKYIVERKAHPASTAFLVNESSSSKPNATDIFRAGGVIWLGLPIYAPSQEREFREILTGQRKTTSKKGTFWFQVTPSEKIITCIQRGAEVRDIRLNVPGGPTNKIVVDIVLSARDISAFRHEGNFLSAWDDELGTPTLPVHEFLGSDFNRIGKYMVATANPDEEHDLTRIMKLYENAHERLEKIRKWELPHVQVQLSKGKDKSGRSLSNEKKGRLKTQVTLLHRRRQRLMKEMKRQALMVYLYVAWKTRARYLGWDAIGGISTRNQRGALAQAITYLPKRKALYDEFRQWACDLKDQGLLSSFHEVIPVSPFNSQTCGHCFQQTGKQERTKVKGIPYDEFHCKNCGRNTQTDSKIHRHSNSARVSALLLQKHVISGGLAPS